MQVMMRILKVLAFVAAFVYGLAACHPVISVGYDGRSVKKGPLAQIAGQPVARQTTQPTAAATDQAVDPADSYSLGIGGGAKNFTIRGTVMVNGVDRSITAPASEGMPRFVSGSAALAGAWSFLRWHGFSTQLHAGPATTVLVDRTTGDRSFAQGLRFGAGAELAVKGLAVYADFHRDVVAFSDGPATGISSVSGITLGVAFHP
jgi:hypothetical protein